MKRKELIFWGTVGATLFSGAGLTVVSYFQKNPKIILEVLKLLVSFPIGCFLGYFYACKKNKSGLDREKLFKFYGFEELDSSEENTSEVIYNDFKDEKFPIQFYWSDSRGINSISSHIMKEDFLRVIIDDNGKDYEASNIAIKPKSNKPKKFNMRFLKIFLKQSAQDFENKKIKDAMEEIFFNIRLVDRYHRHWRCGDRSDPEGKLSYHFNISTSSNWQKETIDTIDRKRFAWRLFKGDGNCIHLGVPNEFKDKPDFSIITSIIFTFGSSSDMIRPAGKNIIDIKEIRLSN